MPHDIGAPDPDDEATAEVERLLEIHESRSNPGPGVDELRDVLADLGGPRGVEALRAIEASGDPERLDALADALIEQPGLPVDLLWRAVGLLEGSGRIEARPELFELRQELVEAIDGDDASLEALIEQIEEDPEDVWVALHGLAEIEADVRAEIVAELGAGGVSIGPGTSDLLRLLAYAHDPTLRLAALEALGASRVDPEDPDDPRASAWSDLASHHPEPEVAALARSKLGGRRAPDRAAPALRDAPRIVSSLVTGLDGRGRGHVALVAEDDRRGLLVASAFECDVLEGIVAVVGRIAAIGDLSEAEALLAELRDRPDRDLVEGDAGLALGLLAGALLLCGPGTTPALRYWIERTAGRDLHPRPFAAAVLGPPPPFEEIAMRAFEVLDACPTWVDASPLVFELAEEILLRWDGDTPDPRRDAGAYRFLFEHRLVDQLELYRRMLNWMGWLWHSAGAAELSRSALTLAEQLSDPQHVVPAHPFTAALSTRSLLAAQRALRLGDDPRAPVPPSRRPPEPCR